jgi:hypothetical protein
VYQPRTTRTERLYTMQPFSVPAIWSSFLIPVARRLITRIILDRRRYTVQYVRGPNILCASFSKIMQQSMCRTTRDTPLHLAAVWGLELIGKALVKHGADYEI